MKKLIMLSMFIACLAIPSLAEASTSMKLFVNTKEITTVKPFMENDTMYVPVNAIAQKMGEKIEFNTYSKELTTRKGKALSVILKADDTEAFVGWKYVPLKMKFVNGEYVDQKTPTLFRDNEMYVPVEFLSAPYGFTYNVEIVKTKNNTSVYVGTLPKDVQKQVNKRTYTLIVNNNTIKSKYSPFMQNGTIYVPYGQITKQFTTPGYKTVVTKKSASAFVNSRYDVTVKTGQTFATFVDKVTIYVRNNTHTVPLGEKIVQGQTVNTKAKAIYKNGDMYVPIEFISSEQGLRYYTYIKKSDDNTTIYIGELPANLSKSIKQTGHIVEDVIVMKHPSNDASVTELVTNQQIYVAKQQGNWFKVSDGKKSGFVPVSKVKLGKSPAKGKMYADGWFAPTITSKFTNNHKGNYKVFENELGFKDGLSYSIYGGRAIETFYSTPRNELTINFYQWENKTLYQSYRIPIIAKELFKYVFGKDADRVYKYFTKNDIPEKFKANGKTVTARFDKNSGVLQLTVYH